VRIAGTRPSSEWSQIQSADVLLLSKPDLADEQARSAFAAIAAAQFPAKRHLGDCRNGELPPESLEKFDRSARFTPLERAAAAPVVSRPFPIGGLVGEETQMQQLGHWAVSFVLPQELIFSRVVIEPRLRWALEAYGAWLRRVKCVFRSGVGPSWLVQSHGHGLSQEDSAYRRDSRMELVLNMEPTPEFLELWRGMLRDAANPPTAPGRGFSS
jgi:G3E family GTPase